MDAQEPDQKTAIQVDEETIKRALREVLDAASDVPLTPKFAGGTLILKPANSELKSREIPIEEFFKKVIRVRDQLRVLEQKINNHESLSNADKNQFQSYVTRAYGALTSFNLLFRDKDDHFVGQKGK